MRNGEILLDGLPAPTVPESGSSMPGFTVHEGKIAVYDADNVDTDRIIPARFLSLTTKSGYGTLLFKDVRGADFPLDDPKAQGASILVAGSNFGCGSSREHAVWALQQSGFRAVIARKRKDLSGFSDIFRQNSANCGLLLIELEEGTHSDIAQLGSGATIRIDLARQAIETGEGSLTFQIDLGLKQALMEGLDMIGTTLRYEDDIRRYEWESPAYVPPKVAVPQ